METKDHTLTQLLSADSLIGKSVENYEEDKIGDIKDLVIDPISGEISYAVLSINTGFLNLESKFFAIPLQAMTVTESHVKFDISKEHLKNAPGFDKDVWPTGPQKEFLSSVYDYYKISRSTGGSSGQTNNDRGNEDLHVMSNPDSKANIHAKAGSVDADQIDQGNYDKDPNSNKQFDR